MYVSVVLNWHYHGEQRIVTTFMEFTVRGGADMYIDNSNASSIISTTTEERIV